MEEQLPGSGSGGASDRLHRFLAERRLIRLVRLQPALYNRRHRQFQDAAHRERLWQRIAAQLAQPVECCRSRWAQLRYRYQRHVRRLRSSRQQAAARPLLLHEEELLFLYAHVARLPSLGTAQQQAQHDYFDDDDDVRIVSPLHEEIIDVDLEYCDEYKLTASQRRLVEAVRAYPQLYDSLHPGYASQRHRGLIWGAIANELREKATRLMKCWLQLQTHYEWQLLHGGERTSLATELEFLAPHVRNMPHSVCRLSLYLQHAWCDPIEHFRSVMQLINVLRTLPDHGPLWNPDATKPPSQAYDEYWQRIGAQLNASHQRCEVTWLLLRSFYLQLSEMRKSGYLLQDKWFFEKHIGALQLQHQQQQVQRQLQRQPLRRSTVDAPAPADALAAAPPAPPTLPLAIVYPAGQRSLDSAASRSSSAQSKGSNTSAIGSRMRRSSIPTGSSLGGLLASSPGSNSLPSKSIEAGSSMEGRANSLTGSTASGNSLPSSNRLLPSTASSSQSNSSSVPKPAPQGTGGNLRIVNVASLQPRPAGAAPAVTPMLLKLTPMPELSLIPASNINKLCAASAEQKASRAMQADSSAIKLASSSIPARRSSLGSVQAPALRIINVRAKQASALAPAPVPVPATVTAAAPTLPASIVPNAFTALPKSSCSGSSSRTQQSAKTMPVAATPATAPAATAPAATAPAATAPAATALPSVRIVVQPSTTASSPGVVRIFADSLGSPMQLELLRAKMLVREIMAIPQLHSSDTQLSDTVHKLWQQIAQKFDIAVDVCRAFWAHLAQDLRTVEQIAPIAQLVRPFKSSIKAWQTSNCLFGKFDEIARKYQWLQHREQLPALLQFLERHEHLYSDLRGAPQEQSKLTEQEKQQVWHMAKAQFPGLNHMDIWCMFKFAFVSYMEDLERGIENPWPQNWWLALRCLRFLIDVRYQPFQPYYYIVHKKYLDEVKRCSMYDALMQSPTTAQPDSRCQVERPLLPWEIESDMEVPAAGSRKRQHVVEQQQQLDEQRQQQLKKQQLKEQQLEKQRQLEEQQKQLERQRQLEKQQQREQQREQQQQLELKKLQQQQLEKQQQQRELEKQQQQQRELEKQQQQQRELEKQQQLEKQRQLEEQQQQQRELEKQQAMERELQQQQQREQKEQQQQTAERFNLDTMRGTLKLSETRTLPTMEAYEFTRLLRRHPDIYLKASTADKRSAWQRLAKELNATGSYSNTFCHISISKLYAFFQLVSAV
ncbi:hypothetical protein KR222_004885 [Zaprionus bogoriensis]|nr:hypothetical protein KR222_004885 [Zaprionus bogoriensis]